MVGASCCVARGLCCVWGVKAGGDLTPIMASTAAVGMATKNHEKAQEGEWEGAVPPAPAFAFAQDWSRTCRRAPADLTFPVAAGASRWAANFHSSLRAWEWPRKITKSHKNGNGRARRREGVGSRKSISLVAVFVRTRALVSFVAFPLPAGQACHAVWRGLFRFPPFRVSS